MVLYTLIGISSTIRRW